MQIKDLDTPALIVDRKILLKNMESMNAILANSNLRLRPHYKTHKCSAIAHLQIDSGAIGMTCSKLSEAMDLVDSGIEDVLIANQIVESQKIRRLADLAAKCKLTVCVDNLENVRALAKAAQDAGSTIHCLVEYELGMERCGVASEEAVIALAEEIGRHAFLRFEGLQAYAGHISHEVDPKKREAATAENSEKLRSLIASLKKKGITVNTVSGGSTGTGLLKAKEGLYTELQAGSYIFMDATYAQLDTPFENSLFLLSTVVSANDKVTVVDSGVKTCGLDQGMPVLEGASVDQIIASEEHFQLHGVSKKFRVGEKLRLIPAHCCSTVNLFDRIYLVEGDMVVDRLLITARGFGK